jgi:acetyl-CoA carboxylase biotin carboxylase subunit
VKRVLIANRGEIAVRILRACREEGLEAVAVYSEADRNSPHVRRADEAVELGPAAAEESYLHIPRLLEAAQQSGADAVHPGYGFLAERAEFARAVEAAGLTFIGPPPSAIEAMGAKTEARRRMRAAGVPVVPGTTEPVADVEMAVEAARDVGYPVLLKAVAGGGGKGMRRVDTETELRSGFQLAASEARKAFGDGALYVERFIERPRHVEIQILADRFGHTIHLGERECSIQRRHQKLIEESPSPAVDIDLRLSMGSAAVKAAQSVGYLGAGTVEFLLDPTGRFHFLEMNTRIQVEHPVTEMVYGTDLVREQLRIAAGKPMTPPGRPMTPRGHAIECRITSENPFDDFLPATGRIEFLNIPTGPGVRWDGGVEVGTEVGLFYDPLLAKLIAWGERRSVALRRMQRALTELVIVGIPTSQPFHARVLAERNFVEGDYHIGYLEEHGEALLAAQPDDLLLERAAVAAALAEEERRVATVGSSARPNTSDGMTPWLRAARLGGLR